MTTSKRSSRIFPDCGKAVADEPPEGAVAERHYVFRGYDFQQVQDLAVLLEYQGVDRGLRVLFPEPAEHGAAQHEAPHFGKEDDQDPLRGLRRYTAPRKEGQRPADERPESLIDLSL